MNYIDLMHGLHSNTKRNYLARVNDHEYPKFKAAELAKKWDYDYWDGSRKINYGGYKYIPGRLTKLAKRIIDIYNLTNKSSILDVGCGKGFLLYEIKLLLPGISISGLDISKYAIKNSKIEVRQFLIYGHANHLPYEDNSFDLVLSINTLHNLYIYDLITSLKEIIRVSRKSSYICIESYRNELEKQNLIYWQVTCEAFFKVDEWEWILNFVNYKGDYSFIFFE
jgi:SAM-dependent methyltransferase